MDISVELLKKYHTSGPRYTCYPTVPYWGQTPTEEEWISSLSTSLDEERSSSVGASLYLHIPFCEKLCTYCGCNTRISRSHRIGLPYVKSVLKEWDLYRSKLGKTITIGEIYLGGGTPTFLNAYELQVLLEGILGNQKARVVSTVEIDPRVTNSDQLKLLYRMGFDHIKMGVEDFDPVIQAAVNRVQSEDEVKRVTDQAREIGFSQISYDLIYGLPFQNEKSIEKTFESIQSLNPDRIAYYGYIHVPWIKKTQRKFGEEDLPQDEEKQRLYLLGRKALESMGYVELGMDHFVKKQDPLWKTFEQGSLYRNFMGYHRGNTFPLLGLGVSAMGESSQIYAQNEKLIESYQSRVENGELPLLRGHTLSKLDLILRQHIAELITRCQTQLNPVSNPEVFAAILSRLESFESDGLVSFKDHSCHVTELGRSFLKTICKAFDTYVS